MRLARLVAAGLVSGAFAGFLGALLRPRSVHSASFADTVGAHRTTSADGAEEEPSPRPRHLADTDVRGCSLKASEPDLLVAGTAC